MLERYFEQPDDAKMVDVRKEFSYQVCVYTNGSSKLMLYLIVMAIRVQVGVTPSFTELPRDHCERMRAFKEADKPLSLCPPEKDPKMRFFWRLGERPVDTKFPELNAAPVVPEGFPEWESVCV